MPNLRAIWKRLRLAETLALSSAAAAIACSPSARTEAGARSSPEGGPGDAQVEAGSDAPATLEEAGGPLGGEPLAEAATSLEAGPRDDADTSNEAGALDPLAQSMHDRADQALATLMLNYWPALAANTTTFDWMYAHYWDAVLDAAERRGPNAFAGTARMFFELQSRRGWFDGYYDDENWVTLALLHAYKVTGDGAYLDQAKTVFADIMKAWDTTCCGAHPGGLWWQKATGTQGPQNKVTAINAGAVISAARLYAGTGDSTYLSFANEVYQHWSTTMVDGATGHVYDGVDNAGNVNTSWSFTYNEGAFIGATVELSRVAGGAANMALAHTVAGYMMSHETETTSLGTILSDGKCGGDALMFKGVGARYLGELFQADPAHTEYRDFLQRSADAAWTLARDPASGNISCDWAGPYDATTGLVGSLGSAAMTLAAAAEALGPGAHRPPLLYEAEEGDLHGVGLEASFAGFRGWGYLAGWGADGQSVDLLVSAPSSGSYTLTWRYATGDDAARTLSVNGQRAGAPLSFPSTGGYTQYATVEGSAMLHAGVNTITLAYVAADGSSGYLNLDDLELSPP